MALKGAIRDFLQSPHCAAVSNTYAQVARAQSCANHGNTSSALHVQPAVYHWYEGTAQLLSLTELKSHLFEFYFID